MLYALPVLLFSYASANEVVNCEEEKPCDPKHKYELEYTFGKTEVQVECKNEKDWYSKTEFELSNDMNFKDYCRLNGYDGIGKIMRATPTNLPADQVTEEEDILCNAKYDVIRNDVDVDREGYSDDHATFQCWDFQPQVDCCKNWQAGCYNTRGAYNNYYACPKDKCSFLCDGNLTSPGCSLCCRNNMEHAVENKPWRCSEEITPEQICARNSGSKSDCKNALAKDEGKCKFKKGKKGSEDKCKLKFSFDKCDELRKRDCKKAVEQGRCAFADDQEKTCKNKDP